MRVERGRESEGAGRVREKFAIHDSTGTGCMMRRGYSKSMISINFISQGSAGNTLTS